MIKQVGAKETGVSFGTQKINTKKNDHKGVDPEVSKRVSNYDIIRSKVTEKVDVKTQQREKINIGL